MADRIVSLTEIPYDWLAPGVHLEVRPNYKNMGLFAFPARALIQAPIASAGTANAGDIQQITRPEQADAFYGLGTIGARMARAFVAANKTSPLFVLGVAEDETWTAASGTITFGGAGRGDLPLYIGGQRVAVTIGADQTTAQIASSFAVAINQRVDLYVTAAAAGAVLTLTAKNLGVLGNEIDLRFGYFADEAMPAGLTADIVPMNGGAGEPDVQTACQDVIAEAWYTDIVSPWSSGAVLSAYELDLAERYKAMGKRDAGLWQAWRGSFGELNAKSAMTNSPHISAIGFSGSPTPSWEWAASLAVSACSTSPTIRRGSSGRCRCPEFCLRQLPSGRPIPSAT